MEKQSSVKIWVSQSDFELIQKGSYPREFKTVPPNNISEHVEMVVNMQTLTEWVTQHTASIKPNKHLLLD